MRTFTIHPLLASAVAVLVVLGPSPLSRAQINAAAPPADATPTGLTHPVNLTADQVVANLMAHNTSRAAALRGYTGRRVYHLQYRGFPGSRSAELTVIAQYNAPATKEFTVVSQSGSGFLVDHVLKRLLTSEEEALNAQNQIQTALSTRNYLFELVGEQVTDQGSFYILKVRPKTPSKFLYRGEIWVDTGDFAIARIEAEPAKNPSFWISHAQFEQKYRKFGSFWLPVRNRSTTNVRLGGTATLVIDYQNYRITYNSQTNAQAAMTELGKAF